MDKYLIDSHKLYWHLDRVNEWLEKGITTPIYIEVSPVSFCNHKCIFCGFDFAKQKAMLDTETLCKRLKEMGQLGVRSIVYSGEGEPLLHKNLPEFVKITKKSRIDVAIVTNGTTGNYELWTKILPYLTWIKFSVDAGSPKVYSKVHNVPEKTFYKTLDSIKKAIKVKNEYKLDVTIGIQFLVLEENLNDIRNAINLFCNLNINYFVLKPYSLHPQMLMKKDVIYNDKIIEYLQNIVDEYKNKTKVDIIFRKDATDQYIRKEKTFNHCYALPFWGHISTKGDFYTCSIFLGDERFKVGNIYNEDMNSIIFGDKRKESIEYAEKKLSIKKECRINCRMARINEFLELLNSKPAHINFI